VVFEGPAGRTARLVLGQPRTGGPWPVAANWSRSVLVCLL